MQWSVSTRAEQGQLFLPWFLHCSFQHIHGWALWPPYQEIEQCRWLRGRLRGNACPACPYLPTKAERHFCPISADWRVDQIQAPGEHLSADRYWRYFHDALSKRHHQLLIRI